MKIITMTLLHVIVDTMNSFFPQITNHTLNILFFSYTVRKSNRYFLLKQNAFMILQKNNNVCRYLVLSIGTKTCTCVDAIKSDLIFFFF